MKFKIFGKEISVKKEEEKKSVLPENLSERAFADYVKEQMCFLRCEVAEDFVICIMELLWAFQYVFFFISPVAMSRSFMVF